MTSESIAKHYAQIEAEGIEPGDLLPPARPELDEGYTVTVCCIHRHAGAFEYPGVILEILTAEGLRGEGRARVQVWKDHLNNGSGGWETFVVDLDCLTLADHEIGACMNCGRYDWYDRFDDECHCSDCQPEPEVEEVEEDYTGYNRPTDDVLYELHLMFQQMRERRTQVRR